ncbi:hypothetical protein GO988_23325 [Hymenobacter sp. HMF4947]|uniref:Uncharacterized protein n=1 Tax=Hymenobacter ginkgonis TaxID=2682976 RepID=A0A7K1TLJ6_9BACT|nr:hypothetical protein [Hymenobacter ginkgonis]MVN79275.1 hypothetical protein [Hymenobacter ginkgonis]
MTAAEVTKRYKEVVKRSFDRHLDLFLTAHFLRSPTQDLANATPQAYAMFQLEPLEWDYYLRSHQAKRLSAAFSATSTVGALDQAIQDWWGKHKVQGLQAFQQAHKQHCISEDDFRALFPLETELCCVYCGITAGQFQRLIRAGQVQTKRLRTRGSTFEIDCREPRLGYAAGNLALCCYWCNNAKSDEFKAEEFQPVAEALGRVWRQRLRNVDNSSLAE